MPALARSAKDNSLLRSNAGTEARPHQTVPISRSEFINTPQVLAAKNTDTNAQQQQQAQKILSDYGEVWPYSTHDFGRAQDENCRSIILDEGKFAAPCTKCARNCRPTGIGTRGTELVVGSGESQFDILRIARSDAINYDNKI